MSVDWQGGLQHAEVPLISAAAGCRMLEIFSGTPGGAHRFGFVRLTLYMPSGTSNIYFRSDAFAVPEDDSTFSHASPKLASCPACTLALLSLSRAVLWPVPYGACLGAYASWAPFSLLHTA